MICRVLRKIVICIKSALKYNNDYFIYCNQLKEFGGFKVEKKKRYIFDYLDNAGNIDGHYFFQDIYVANLVANSEKRVHYDIGSRMDGFVAHLLANPSIEKLVMIDIRPFPYKVDRLSFVQSDATSLDNIQDESIDSLSSLHAIEHFGLGRYGDEIDTVACFKAMKAMQRVLKKGGMLYISCPISNNDSCVFNAHRIFSPNTVLASFENMDLVSFAYIHRRKLTILENEEAVAYIQMGQFDFDEYDCGIFVFRKK